MNRIFRAAELSAAAAALCAALSFAAPSTAEELRAGTAAQGAAAAAAPTGYLAQIYNRAMDALTGTAQPSEAPAPLRKLDQLVAHYEGAAIADREQDCLANAVYFESRGEPVEGQLAVAQVVLNRAASGRYPTSLCAVITQKAQFSFIRHGRFPAADKGSEAWRKAVAVAKIAREKLAPSVPDDVLWYHATYVAPSWGKRLNRTTQIGLHIFYS
ncbi:MAG: cell wall hydrolase [Alphaproteobacteria bacterium]|nr:cell wall hydrolase [Alphaproteobacteria bacterium]MBV9371552.1 cell wall hydrolase [Alphaproteobacteria bacterium]MBV9902706.1 cell wall hydrolase [Alphaproteobacteria bacterium]